MPVHYEWYVVGKDRRGRETRRKLRWRMTLQDAVAWAEANPGKVLEVVPGSGEDRGPPGSYVGWGQALEQESVEPTREMGDRWRPKRC